MEALLQLGEARRVRPYPATETTELATGVLEIGGARLHALEQGAQRRIDVYGLRQIPQDH